MNALWRLVSAVSSVIASLLAFKLYERYLGKSLYGLVQTALILVGLLPQFDGGFRLVINRRLLAGAEPAERRRLVDFAQILYSWGALAAGLIGLVVLGLYSLGPSARAVGEPRSFYLALGTLGALAVLASAQAQLLTGLGRQQQLFVLNAAGAWTYLGLLWILLQSGQRLWAFPLAQLGLLGGTAIVAWGLARRDLPGLRLLDFRWDEARGVRFRELWREAAPAFVCQLVMLVLYAGDAVVAAVLLPGTGASEVVFAARLFTMLRQTLQSADEAIWPRLAAGAAGAAQTSASLVRINAVLYGVVMTVAGVTLPQFAGYYVPGLKPAAWVLWLFAVRYLITGLGSQPAYYLYGHGRFGQLARHLGLELVVAVVLSCFFAPTHAAAGVAAGFALATLFGVAVPLPWAYAAAATLRPGAHFRAVWLRAIPAAAISAGLCWLLLPHAKGWLATMLVGAGVTLLVLGGFVVLAWWRAGRSSQGKVDVRGLASHF